MNSGKVLTIKELNNLKYVIDYGKNENIVAKKILASCTLDDLKKSLEYYCNIGNNTMVAKIKELIVLYEYYQKNFKENKNAKYHCSAKELDEKMKVLNVIYRAIISKDTDYHKAEVIIKYYTKAEDFYGAYHLFVKYGKNDHDLDQARDALNNFDEICKFIKKCEDEGIYKNIKYLQSLKKYIEIKDYASFVIRTYATSDFQQESEFCDKIGIGEPTFDFCLDVVETLDYDTYTLYLQRKEAEVKWQLDILEDLANGITTGVLKDGTPFDTLEFIKRFPFKNKMNLLPVLNGFLTKNNRKELIDTLVTFVWSNSIDNPNFFDPLNLNTLYSGNTYINDKVITPEIKKGIVAYLHQNNLPAIYKTYLIIRDKYINGEIKLPECEYTERKITLIH